MHPAFDHAGAAWAGKENTLWLLYFELGGPPAEGGKPTLNCAAAYL